MNLINLPLSRTRATRLLNRMIAERLKVIYSPWLGRIVEKEECERVLAI